MRAFYTLPDPREAGLKWKEYERAREKVANVERRLEEAQNRRAQVEEEIRRLGDADVSELAQAILRGEDDPGAKHDEHQRLVAEVRELRRQEQAYSQALPTAEEELRQCVYAHQHRWKEQADEALERAHAEERQAYGKARRLIEEPRAKRLYLEALSKWVRYPQPTFGADGDIAVHSTIQNLESSAYAAEQWMEERRQAERLQEQQAKLEAS